MQKLRILSLALMLSLIFISTTSAYAADPTSENNQTIQSPEGYKLIPMGRYSSASPVSDGMIAVRIGNLYGGLWGFVDATTGKEAVAPKYLSNGETLHFFDGMAKVYVRDKGWTFIAKNGKEIFPAGKYGTVSDFVNGIASVSADGKGDGLIDKTGKEVVKPGTYTGGTNLSYTEAFKTNRIVVYKWDKKTQQFLTGCIDTKGNVVIPFGKYPSIDNFSDGLARVIVGNVGKKGYRQFYIDLNGKEVLSPKIGPVANPYGYADFSGGLAQFGYQIETKVNKRYGDVIVTGGYEQYLGYIDNTGKVVIPLTNKYNTAEQFVNGYSILWYGPAYDFMETDTNFIKNDIIDKTGKVVLSTTAKDERFRVPSNGLVAKAYEMRYPDNTSLFVGGVNHERMWKVYNLSTGKNLIPDGYNVMPDHFNPPQSFYDEDFPDGMIKLYKTEQVYPNGLACSSVINSQGKVIVSGDKYASVDLYSEKKVAVCDMKGLWGYLDTNGNEIIAPQFDGAAPFREGKAIVAVHAGKDTARESVDEGVDEADEFNFYILQKK